MSDLKTYEKFDKFKFIFEDSTVSFVDGHYDYREATILALSNRIRSKKSDRLLGVFAKTEGEWKKVGVQSITLTLRSAM